MSPYEYTEAVQSGLYRFSLPEHIDYEADYIVSDTDTEEKELLSSLGFDQYEFEHYTLYSYDMSSYSHKDVQVVWDAG